MSGGTSQSQVGETSRRRRGRPRKVPPPPYEDPPIWYPRVTRSLTPEKVAAAEAAYFRDFLRRWARGEFTEQNRRPLRDAEGIPIRGFTEGNPILIDEEEDQDVDLGGSHVRPTLGLTPGFYTLVSVPQMEEDMDISEDDVVPNPPQGTVSPPAHDDEVFAGKPTGVWPPGWGPGLFKLVPISQAEVGLNICESNVITIPPRDTMPPPPRDTVASPAQDDGKSAEKTADGIREHEKETVTGRQNPPMHRETPTAPPFGDGDSCGKYGLLGCPSPSSGR